MLCENKDCKKRAKTYFNKRRYCKKCFKIKSQERKKNRISKLNKNYRDKINERRLQDGRN